MGNQQHEGQPWAKRPEESTRQFQAFLWYLDLGADCSVEKVAQKTGYSQKQAERLSSRFAWSFRADQWDAWQAQQKVSVRTSQGAG